MDTSTGSLPTRSLTWVNEWLSEDVVAAEAREMAAQLGIPCVDVLTAATLRWLAATTVSKAIVEVGTGAGVSTLALARGMAEDGILTTIDLDAQTQRHAKAMLSDAGYPRIRLIAGRALDVMPRLTDAGYDLVVCDGAATETAAYLEQAARLLRHGGVLAIIDALGTGFRVTDPAAREPEVVSLRAALKTIADDEGWVPALLPVGTGLVVASRV